MISNPVLLALLIAAAGGAGSVIRVYLTRWEGPVPFGVILTNSLAAGFVGYIYSGNLTQDYLLIASVGFAGGLSTFSGIAKAGFDFWHTGRLAQIFISLAANIVVPLLALMLVMYWF
ncbi:MAG TPA: CrcB family protein [Aquiluna sp.]